MSNFSARSDFAPPSPTPCRLHPDPTHTPNPAFNREAMYVTTLVKALSQKYPQSVYYTMRAFLLERREQPDRGVAGGSGGAGVDSTKLSKATSVRLPNGQMVSLLRPFMPGTIPVATNFCARSSHRDERVTLTNFSDLRCCPQKTITEPFIYSYRTAPVESRAKMLHAD